MSVTVPVAEVPVITIFVRHSADCRYRGEEFHKNCRCRKHLRWSYGGKQFRQSAKTRSWTQAEQVKRKVEEKFATATSRHVGVQVERDSAKTTEQAVQLFVKDRRNEGRGSDVIAKYERELGRLKDFMARRGKFFPAEINADDLTEFISDWTTLYPSSVTRNRVLTRLRAFLKYCYNRKWSDRIPQTVAIKPKKSETLPLEPAQYNKLLEAIPKVLKAERAKKAHALVQLMRWSGLAIRDAVTLEREEIEKDAKGNYRVITTRTKTKMHVNVRIPADVTEEVLAVANGSPKYLFWNSGQGTERTITTDWSDELRKVFRAAGLPKGHPHQLRDTFAVELLKNGVPLEEVSRALGHDSIKTTEKYYAKWVKARQDRLDDLIAGTWNAQKKELHATDEGR